MKWQKRDNRDYRKKTFSELLIERIAEEPFPAGLWQRAADSLPANRRRQCIRTAIAVGIGVPVGAVLMHFILVRAMDSILIYNFA